jgi:ferredoxin
MIIPMSHADEPPFFTGLTRPDGQQFDAWANQPLLISMEQGGVNWPSSCRNGTCRTCFGKLESGRARYQIEWPGLSADEKEEGYVLPCVAYPCSDVILHKGE